MEPPQSFFQRARAKRLQLKAVDASTQVEGRKENDSVMTPPGTYFLKASESSVKACGSDCTTPDLSESLTCPVCFRQVDTADLNVFNTHIDVCLSSAPGKPMQICEASHKRGDSEAEEEEVKGSEDLESAGDHLQEFGWENDSVQRAIPNSGGEQTGTSQQPPSCSDKRPVLICPICQLTQDSDDLIIFNHHVDVCLNQEVLHELGGQALISLSPNSKASGKRVFVCV